MPKGPGTQKRRRTAFAGRVDVDSDDEDGTEVERGIVFDTTTGIGTSTYRVHSVEPTSRKRSRSESMVPEESENSGDTINPEKQTPPRKQGASVMMDTFREHFDDLQDAILSREHHPDVGSKCGCGGGLATFRCEQCFICHMSCAKCIVASHLHLPFHWIQEWNGLYFKRRELVELGGIVALGHYGHRCPNRPKASSGRRTVVTDVNGIHNVRVEYCHCVQASSEAIQLVQSGLFPATIEKPETAFTFTVLKDFHLHTLCSKKSAYDHFSALRKHTDNPFPHKTHDRYREFMRVARVWKHLTAVRRAGHVHGIDAILVHRRQKSLAVRCPACPEVHFNVEKEVIDNAPVEEKHKYTAFRSADGNFRLQRKNKKDDEDDVALNGGNAYFVENSAYKEYVKKACAVADPKSTCSRLKAVKMQNIAKFKNAVVTGVVAIQCTRHGFFMPQGMVDLQKGEKFANTDYALAFALKEDRLQRWLKFSYDIWCQYGIYLLQRFEEWFPDSLDIVEKMEGLIPSMHIQGHKDDCIYQFSFAYTEGTGRTSGELVEVAWSEGNQTAGSTKEMNEGHRHDTLDDFHGHWNWEKIHKLGHSLYRQYTNAAAMLKTISPAFEALTARHDPKLITKWSALNSAPRKVNGKVTSVYRSRFDKGPPSQGQVLRRLLQQELTDELGGDCKGDKVNFMNNGIRIEAEQIRIRILASKKSFKLTKSEDEALTSARVKLHRSIEKWRQAQFNLIPGFRDHLKAIDPSTPEEEELMLPSSLDSARRESLCLGELGRVEYQLREGQAHDALRDLREAIKEFNANLRYKKDVIHGQNANTRAQEFLRTLSSNKTNAADKYRRARRALLALGMAEDNAVLQPLYDNQLWMKDVMEKRKLGDGKKEDPWFWTVGRPNGMSDEEQSEWSEEVERVKWFRDRAIRDHWTEEKETLEEEFDRTTISYTCMKDVWKKLAACKAERPGQVAYAHKQSAMWEGLATDCALLYKQAKVKVAAQG